MMDFIVNLSLIFSLFIFIVSTRCLPVIVFPLYSYIIYPSVKVKWKETQKREIMSEKENRERERDMTGEMKDSEKGSWGAEAKIKREKGGRGRRRVGVRPGQAERTENKL